MAKALCVSFRFRPSLTVWVTQVDVRARLYQHAGHAHVAEPARIVQRHEHVGWQRPVTQRVIGAVVEVSACCNGLSQRDLIAGLDRIHEKGG